MTIVPEVPREVDGRHSAGAERPLDAVSALEGGVEALGQVHDVDDKVTRCGFLSERREQYLRAWLPLSAATYRETAHYTCRRRIGVAPVPVARPRATPDGNPRGRSHAMSHADAPRREQGDSQNNRSDNGSDRHD